MYKRKLREALEISRLKTLNETDKTFKVLNRDDGDQWLQCSGCSSKKPFNGCSKLVKILSFYLKTSFINVFNLKNCEIRRLLIDVYVMESNSDA